MNKKILKLMRNIGIIIILFILFMRFNALSLSPLAAYEKTERSLHYGPSDIVHIEDIDGGKLFLGKYDRWVSFIPVKRELIFFWRPSGFSLGMEIDESQVLNFWLGMSDDTYYCFGIINDHRVQELELILEDGRLFRESDFYDDDLFMITWESHSEYDGWAETYIRAYDANDDLIYEDNN